MKKIILLIVIIILAYGGYYAYKTSQQSSTAGETSQPDQTPTIAETPKEEQLVAAGKEVLKAMTAKDFSMLATLTSSEGLSLNEIPNLDFSVSNLPQSQISQIPTDTETFMWGYTDGKGDEIELTRKEYFEKYLFNHDYLNAPVVAVNETLGRGNSLNTIIADSGERNFVAFHFAGFNPTYEGMDWTTLYLVFDLEGGKYKLRGIAKDNWTI